MAIVIKTLSDSSQARKDLSQLRASVDGIKASADGFASKMSTVATSLALAGGAAATATAIIKLSDSFTNLENRINSVTQSAADAKNALNAIYDVALQTRTSIDPVSKLFSKMTLAAKDLGATQEQIARATLAISQGFKISGATAEESKAAITQLSQAFASGKLAGDEFNSVLENAPYLARQITEGMGVTLGQLYKMRDEGKLFAKDVLGAILKRTGEINNQFKKVKVTFADAFTNLGNAGKLLFKNFGNILSGGNGFGLADMINNWALGIADFARNLELNLHIAKANVLLFALDVTNFFTDMWDAVVEGGPEAILDFFKDLPNKALALLGEAGKFAQRIVDIMLPYAEAFYSGASTMFFGFLAWLRKSDRTAGVAKVLENWNNQLLEFGRRTATAFQNINLSGLSTQIQKAFKDITGLSFKDVGDKILKAVHDVWTAIVNFDYSIIGKKIEEAFNKIRKVDVAKFFPTLDQALATVKKWAEKVTYWFWWVYDKVIGHSYIPDLVEGVAKWVSKLTGGPLSAIKKFASLASGAFAAIKFAPKMALPSAKAFGLGATALVGAGYIFRKELGLESTFKNAAVYWNKIVDKIGHNPLTDAISKFINSPLLIDKKNPFTGEVTDKLIKRKETFDILRIPRDKQAAVGFGIAGAITAGLYALLPDGNLKNIIISLFTTGALVGISRSMDKGQITDFFLAAGNKLLELLNKGIKGLLGTDVIKDPLGFLSLAAKFSLLFKEGREYFLGLAKSIALAPTQVGTNLGNDIALVAAKSQLAKADKALAETVTRMQNQLKLATNSYTGSVSTIARTLGPLGTPIGMQAAQQQVNLAASDPTAYGRASPEVQRAADLKKFNDELTQKIDTVKTNAADKTKQTRAEIEKAEAERTERLANRKTAFRDFFGNATGAVGAAVGLNAGTQINEARTKARTEDAVKALTENANVTIDGKRLSTEQAQKVASGEIKIGDLDKAGQAIADNIVKGIDVPAWQKIGIAIGASAVGSGLGALVGSLASGAVYAAGEKIGALAAEPLKTGLAIIREKTAAAARRVWDWANAVAIIALQRTAAIANGILMAAPLLLVPALIVAAVVGAAYLIYKYWDQIKAVLIAAAKFIWEAFSNPVKFWTVTFPRLVRAVFDYVKEPVKLAAKYIWDAFTDPVKWWTETFPGIIKKAFKWVTDWWDGKEEKAVAERNNDNIARAKANDPLKAAVHAYADGGYVSGKGTGRSDSILAWLSNGEFVVNADATRRNRGVLDQMNSGEYPSDRYGGPNFKATKRIFERRMKPWFDQYKQLEADYESNKISDAEYDRRSAFFDQVMARPRQIALEALRAAAARDMALWKNRPTTARSWGQTDADLARLNVEDQRKWSADRFATGGVVTGPGTGTSDSIPALLSNGEYVINAAAARRNRDILEAINSGKIARFAGGGSTDGKRSSDIVVTATIGNRQADIIGGKIAEALAKAADLRSSASRNKIAPLRDAAFREASAIEATAARLSRTRSLLTGNNNELAGGGPAETEEEKKKRKERAAKTPDTTEKFDLKFSDELSAINEFFPKVNLSMEEYLQMTGQARADLLGIVLPMKSLRDKLNDTDAGSGQVFNAQQDLEARRKSRENEVAEIVSFRRDPFKDLNPRLEALGQSIEEGAFRSFTPEMVNTVREYVKNQEEWAKAIEANPLDQTAVRDLRLKMDKANTELAKAITRQQALNSADTYVRGTFNFDEAGISIGRDQYNRLSDAARERIASLVQRVIDLQKAIDEGTVTGQARLNAQAELDATRTAIDTTLVDPTAKAKAAGEDFTAKMRDAFSDGMFKFLRKGKFDVLGLANTFVDNILKNFTDSLSSGLFKKNGLLQGLTDQIGRGSVGDGQGGGFLSGVDGLLGKGAKGIGKVFGGGGKKLAEGIADVAPKAGVDVAAPLLKDASKIGSDIGKEATKAIGGGSGGGGIGIGAAAGIGSLAGLLFGKLFAEGGDVRGPGTSTSDSIPARLSNGEFVVRAKAVKKYRPLLHAINTDQVAKFADGGYVGVETASASSAANTIAPVKVSNDNSSQTTNLQIIGDISRQTKREVYQMIPQIAAGVNAYNRERGIK